MRWSVLHPGVFCRRCALHHPRQGLRPWTRKRTRTVPACPLSCPPPPMPVPQARLVRCNAH